MASLPTLFSLVFVAIGVSILRFGVRMTAKARQSESWPTAQGEVSHSAVLDRIDTSTTAGNSTAYKADVAYRYKVNGRDYSSSKIALLDLVSTLGSAQSIVERYPDKSPVDVFYNPADPSEAVLEPGVSSGLNFLFVFGGLFTLAGVFFLVMSLTGRMHVA